MMRLHWTDDALADLDRLYDFLAVANPGAAERAVRMLLRVPNILTTHPAMGGRVEKPGHEDVRRLIVGAYEVRYRVSDQIVEILHVFHTRENR
jgi:plasmid stabilization system protein ParE